MLNFGLLPDRKALNELSPLMTGYRRKIIKTLLDVTPEDYSRTREIKTIQKYDKILERLYSETKKWMEKHVRDSFFRARNIGIRIMEGYGQKRNLTYSKTDTVLALEQQMNNMDTYFRNMILSTQQISRQYFNILRQATRKFLEIREIGGLSDEDTVVLLSQIEELVEDEASAGRISSLVQSHLKKRVGDGNLVEINGRYYDIKKHSESIARTELRRTQSAGVKNACDEYGNDLIEISDHGTTTPICMEYEGRIFSLYGKTPGYEVIDMLPPFHTNCKHSCLPTSEAAITSRGN
jgi:hypothetical protein